jgi:hypothetical protein
MGEGISLDCKSSREQSQRQRQVGKTLFGFPRLKKSMKAADIYGTFTSVSQNVNTSAGRTDSDGEVKCTKCGFPTVKGLPCWNCGIPN